MSTSLDMSLDDIIRKNKRFGGQKVNSRGNVSGKGPDRRAPYHDLIRPTPYPVPRVQAIMRRQQTMPSGRINRETGTKLYVSNLDYGVTNEDIMLLFSDVGEMKRHSIHYDRSGRSKGTAEVVFYRHSDALAAIQRYKNLYLDGKSINIELVGMNLVSPDPVPPTKNIILENSNGGFRSGQDRVGAKEWVCRGGGSAFDTDGGQASGRRHRQDNRRGQQLTAEGLNADLDRYHLEAMRIK